MQNPGYNNTGDNNTGNCNTGDNNIGHGNTGYCNTGDNNPGYCNTGYNNTGHGNTGDCNTNTPNVRIFNHDSGFTFFDNNHKTFRKIIKKYTKLLSIWVFERHMTKTEKEQNLTYKTTGGYLKVNGITNNRIEVKKEDQDFLRSINGFTEEILKETTGIVFNTNKKIIIDGKEIEISLDSFNKLKESLND